VKKTVLSQCVVASVGLARYTPVLMNISDLPDGPVQGLSEEFFRILGRRVEFEGVFQGDASLRERVLRLVARGRSEEAVQLLRNNSDLSEREAGDLVERIGSIADQVHYATGLRPTLAGD
jgi:hypothetical protein